MIEKTIIIDDMPVKFAASADTPRLYRNEFNADMIRDLMHIKGTDDFNIEVINQVAYAMAKQATPNIAPYEEWLTQFGLFSIVAAMPEMLDLWGKNLATSARPKKK